MDRINIRDIKKGDLFWECEDGQDAFFIATDNAHKEPHGIGVNGREIPNGAPCHFFENDRASGYGPRLYSAPQYTRPNYPILLSALANIMQAIAAEDAQQAAARESGLKLAATQYSESRDKWQADAKTAQAEIARLRGIIDEIDAIAMRPANGIDLSNRIRLLTANDK